MSTASSTSPSASRRSTKGQRVLIGTAIVFFALVAAYLALIIITRVDSIFFPGSQITLPGASVVNKVLPGVDANGDSGSDQPINILVMGLDRRPSDGDTPTRTDTLFVVHVDLKNNSSSILGIPRDLVVDIPGKQSGTYEDRINTVYVAGELGKYPNGGIGLMKQVLGTDPFNVKIDKYVIIDFNGFESIIDALGGIDVDVPDEVYDPYYSESEKPGDYNPQHFYPGVQHMDGTTALAYSRIRFSSDDLDRIQRQQRVIFAAIAKAKSAEVLSPSNSVPLWNKYKDAIKTDINDIQIPGYAKLADHVKDHLQAVSLGSATVPCTTSGGAQVLCGDAKQIARITDAVFRDQPDPSAQQTVTAPQPVNVQVQNGTSTDSLARRVVAYIAAKGYPVDNLAADNVFDGKSHDKTEIIDVDGSNNQNAYVIADWLKIPVSRVRTATADEKAALTGNPDIVVILGGDQDFTALLDTPTTPSGG